MMTAGPIERNFIPHSTTLARRWVTGNRWRVGGGYGFGRFLRNAGGGPAVCAWVRLVAFGGCVGCGIGVSHGDAEARRGARGREP